MSEDRRAKDRGYEKPGGGRREGWLNNAMFDTWDTIFGNQFPSPPSTIGAYSGDPMQGQRIVAPPPIQPIQFPQQQGFSVGDVGGWMKDKAGELGGWLGEGDNLKNVGGLALGAYSQYQQGKASDQELRRAEENRQEEQRRYEDDRKRKADAAKALLPFLMKNMERSGR